MRQTNRLYRLTDRQTDRQKDDLDRDRQTKDER